MRKLWSENWRTWLAIVAASTIVLGTAYAMVQQAARESANDEPVKLSQQLKAQIEDGLPAGNVLPKYSVDLPGDNSVFAIITDSQARIQVSNVSIDGETNVRPPRGVFDNAKQKGSNTVTWQPKENVRIASYTVPYNSAAGSGSILTGQSLKPVEDRIAIFGLLAVLGWLAVVFVTSLVLLVPLPSRK